MSDDVTIPREAAVRMAADYRISSTDPTVRATEAERQTYRQWADLLDPPAPPLTLAQEATVERLVAGGYDRAEVVRGLGEGRYANWTTSITAGLNLAARDPLRLLAEHGTPLTEEPPEGTWVLIVPRDGGNPWVWHGFSTWGWAKACGTVYRLGGAS